MHIDVQTCQRGIPEYNMISSLLNERWNQSPLIGVDGLATISDV